MQTGQVAPPGGLPGQEAKRGDFGFLSRMRVFHISKSSKFQVGRIGFNSQVALEKEIIVPIPLKLRYQTTLGKATLGLIIFPARDSGSMLSPKKKAQADACANGGAHSFILQRFPVTMLLTWNLKLNST
jgi:hypothetical protein